MNKVLVATLLFVILFCGVVPISAQQSPSRRFEPSEKAWKWADKELKKMSVEEKVGQVVYIGLNAKFANEDSEYFKDLRR